MAALIIINIALSMTVFTVIVGLLVWSIASQDGTAPPPPGGVDMFEMEAGATGPHWLPLRRRGVRGVARDHRASFPTMRSSLVSPTAWWILPLTLGERNSRDRDRPSISRAVRGRVAMEQ